MVVLTRLWRDILKENNKSEPFTNECQVRTYCVWVTQKIPTINASAKQK